MNRNFPQYVLSIAVLAALLNIAACSAPVPTGTGYRPISKEMLIGAEYSHPTGGKYGKLGWEFSATEFVITTDGETIPPGLVAAIAGIEQPAKEVQGTWDLQNETLLISHVTLDQSTEVPGKRSARIFFTGVIRIQTAGTQYVFDLPRKPPE